MKNRIITILSASIGIILLIIDAKTALSGALEGIQLCLLTVIPSLFPFIFLTAMLTNALSGKALPFMRPLNKLLRIPKGSESLFLVGILGGYPTGAQSLTHAYNCGIISKKDASRMLGFCNNAGPAFLFGIISASFPDSRSVWVLWMIHLLSAVAAGCLLPSGNHSNVVIPSVSPDPPAKILERSIKVMSCICGWIILFRTVLAFGNRWFLWLLNTPAHITFNGILELTIGCTALHYIPNEGLRYIICAGILSFGGICVLMQTASVTKALGLGMYLPGKIMQCSFSIALASIYQFYAYSDARKVNTPLYFIALLLVIPIFLSIILQRKEKNIAFLQKL